MLLLLSLFKSRAVSNIIMLLIKAIVSSGVFVLSVKSEERPQADSNLCNIRAIPSITEFCKMPKM